MGPSDHAAYTKFLTVPDSPAGSSDVFRLTDATSKAGVWALLIPAFAKVIANAGAKIACATENTTLIRPLLSPDPTRPAASAWT